MPKPLGLKIPDSLSPVSYTHLFREVYSPYSTSKSTLFKYRWVLYQIILPHLQNDVLLDCVSEEFLNKLLDSCQGYCQNGGYYAYKLLNIILWSAYQNNYIPEKEFPTLKHYSDPQHKSVFLSTEPVSYTHLKEAIPEFKEAGVSLFIWDGVPWYDDLRNMTAHTIIATPAVWIPFEDQKNLLQNG